MGDKVQNNCLRLSGHVVLLRDQSTSMVNATRFPEAWNGLLDSLSLNNILLTTYSVTKEIMLEEKSVPTHSAKRLDPQKWHHRDGGCLKGGSALADAIIVGSEFCCALRAEGYNGPLALVLLTDGYSRLDKRSFEEAKSALEAARSNDVSFKFLGFVNQQYESLLAMFIFRVGISPEEVQLTMYERQEDLDASMSQSVADLRTHVTLSRSQWTVFNNQPKLE